jgi:hypothetical protein
VAPAEADKTSLRAEIARAEALSQGSYTDASFANMLTALAAARDVAARENATQKAVNDAKNALVAAVNALKTVSGGTGQNARRYATIGVADPGAHDGQTSVYYGSRRIEISSDETAFSLLQKTGLRIKYSGHPEYAGYYVESINGFGEFDDGPNSGWMYSVNGRFPDYSCSLYYLEDGDTVRWLYTRDLGEDIDAAYAIGGASASDSSADKPEDEKDAQESGTAGGGGGGAPVATVTVEAKTTTDAGTGKTVAKVETETVTKAVEEAVKAVEEAKAAGEKNAIAEIKIVAKAEPAAGTGASESVPAVKTAEADIPAEAVKAIAEAKDLILTVESDISTVTFDVKTVAGLAAEATAGETVRIVATAVETADAEALNAKQREKVGGNPVIDLAVYIGDAVVRDFKGNASVSVPYAPPADLKADDHDLLTVYFLDDDGGVSEMKGAKYDAKTGKIAFTTTHFGKFLVSEWISPFTDIKRDDWFYKAVRFAYSDGLISGTTDTTFAPGTRLSRAMLITILAREAGIDTAGGETWYAKAAEWGVANGVTDGTNMTDDVTREQFATVLFRYAKIKGGDAVLTAAGSAGDLSDFADAEAVSDWASEAMAWAVGKGLIAGRTETTLAPEGTATRAEAATLLQRYVENM